MVSAVEIGTLIDRDPVIRGGRPKIADKTKVEAGRKIEAELSQVLNSEMHRWFVGKMSPAERAARKKAAEEFKKRYAQ